MSKLSTTEVRPNLVADAVRRHVLLILACLVVLAAAAAGLGVAMGDSFTSSTKVLIRPTLGNSLSPDTGDSGQQVTIAMQTEALVAQSSGVAKLANAKLTTPWVPGSGTVTTTVAPNTQVVQISFSAPTAAGAQSGAQTVAQAYLDYRSQQTAETQKARLAILTKQAEAVKKSLDAASKAASATEAAPEAIQQVQLYANQLVMIQNSISTLEASGAAPGMVVAPATLPTAPSGLSPVLLAVAGGLLGLGLGVLLAIWLERRDKRVRGREDTSVEGLPVLAVEDGAARRRRSREPQPVADRVRAAVLATTSTPAVLNVSGVTEGTSSSAVAVDLGIALVDAGYDVVLVNAQRDRGIEELLGLSSGTGLSTALAGAEPDEVVTRVHGMRVMPAGADLADSESLLFSERFAGILEGFRANADFVIVGSPAATTPVGLGMGASADTTLLVATDRATTAYEIGGVVTHAAQLGIALLGLVVTARHRGRTSASRGALTTSQGALGQAETDIPVEADSTRADAADEATPGTQAMARPDDATEAATDPLASR